MVKIFGFNFMTGRKFDKLNSNIEKAYSDAKFGNMRAQLDYIKNLGGEEVRIPYYPLHERTLFDIPVYSDVLRTIHMQLKKEIFRHGYLIEEKFAMKCEQCNKEFKHPVDECDDCKKKGLPSTNIRDPDVKQKEKLTVFLKKCNDNDQDILDVSSEINDDLETVDDGYMQLIKDYYWDREGNILSAVPVELLRVHPMHVRIVADKTGRPGRDADGRPVLVCIDHREKYYQDITNCPQCDKPLFPAYFRTEGYEETQQYTYYVKGEILHKSKYKPSLTYGFPPILSCWLKITTLMAQDRYINTYYTKQRPPRGLFLVNTPNMNSFEKAWNQMLDTYKKNPHQISTLAIENPGGSKGKLGEFIDFMRPLDEMQFIEQRNEFRRQIGAVYGVMPLFQADLSDSGGLNNEGLQITVTNRAVQDGQGVYNDGFYPWLLDQLNITDYTLILEPSEEKDESAEQTLRQMKITNARAMQSMGYEVTLNEDNEFEFEPTEEPVPPPNDMGGMGGLPGLDTGGISGTPSGSPSSEQPKPPSPQRFGGEPESVERDKTKEDDDDEYDDDEEEESNITQQGYGAYKIK